MALCSTQIPRGFDEPIPAIDFSYYQALNEEELDRDEDEDDPMDDWAREQPKWYDPRTWFKGESKDPEPPQQRRSATGAPPPGGGSAKLPGVRVSGTGAASSVGADSGNKAKLSQVLSKLLGGGGEAMGAGNQVMPVAADHAKIKAVAAIEVPDVEEGSGRGPLEGGTSRESPELSQGSTGHK